MLFVADRQWDIDWCIGKCGVCWYCRAERLQDIVFQLPQVSIVVCRCT